MDIDSYQKQASTTAQYAGSGEYFGLSYAALGLSGEAGEIANVVKKVHRDDAGVLNPKKREQLKKELGDCLWYCAALAGELGCTLSEVAQANLDKLFDRKERGVIQGSGDNR